MSHRPDTTLLTIGHSNHELGNLIGLLRFHGVSAVADVRSWPYSRSNPQFNREEFQQSLKSNGIAYVFLGRELGGRPEDASCYLDGTVQYRKLAEMPLFKKGLERILEGARTHHIVLLCAEAEPLVCHRTLLVAQELARGGIHVKHVHSDGRLEPHVDALYRLVKMLGLSEKDLYRTSEQMIEDACSLQGRRIAYSKQMSEKASA